MTGIIEKHIFLLFRFLLLKALRGNMEEIKFNKRAFYSTGMLIAGILLPISGILNHQTGFDEFTTERHFWMSVHNVSAILFTVFAILHIRLNWKPLKGYIKKAKSVIVSREVLYAAALVIFAVGMFSLHAIAAGR